MATYKETSHTFGTFISELQSVNTTFIAKLNFEDRYLFFNSYRYFCIELAKEMIESTSQSQE